MTDAKTPTPAASKKTAAVQSDPAKLPEVESNHNTLDPAKPVETAQVKSMPDYNPQRKKSSFANIQSDTTRNAHDDEKLVETKGDAETVEERDATSPWGEKTGASAEGAEDGTDAARAPTNKATPPADKSATAASEAAKK
ncbi:hypothetical protein [Sphingomonas phage Kharn]|uniref:Uncharacterized protein n=1 Tax=Sphingomonas phage Kharn TaxID=2686312 RepID=A0A6M3T9Y5_9CAUD|nr:hypothetical protein P9A29_gp47 [Sphingomonas phage Kharn]QJD54549.1 hypothetical protein [Sphingomonas phage Kharn]